MKVLLVNPPRSAANAILEHAPDEARPYIHKKLVGPPVGLLTIAGAVDRDHEVSLLELKGEYDLDPSLPDAPALVRQRLAEFRPDVVGVTFIASEFPAGMEILRAVKAEDPDILTVAGGLHATVCPEDFLDPCVDVVCPGQCASVFRDLVEARASGKPLERVKGVFLNTEKGQAFTGAPAASWEPAGRDYIMPDRSYLKKYISTYYVGDAGSPSTYVFTSLGCPFRCTFCSIWGQFGGGYYLRDIESVVRELGDIPEYGVVRFSDANTIVDHEFIGRLFDRILEEGIRKTYIMDIRFDTAARHPRLIEKLARAGLRVVICGFESFRNEELALYRKSATADLIAEAIDVFHANGILLRGNYVVHPDYTEVDFRALADYAGEHRVSYAGYTVLTPMPGTPLHAEMRDRIIDRDLSKYNFFNCVFRTVLPLEKFYENMARLWLIKKGSDVI